jgi:gamma-glutamyl-gamma-aminobutyraldehyde dehydrogenase
MCEVCKAGSRLLVDRSNYGEFVERFVAAGKSAYVPGDPLDPGTNLGPLVTRDAQQRVLSLIDSARKDGATLKFGGTAPDGLEKGAYVTPTLFTDVNNRMRIAREEIFGPVATVIPFDGVEEGIAIANDTIYGLAAGIWTQDLTRAHRLIREIEAGVIWVNCFDEGDMTQPFGGYKQSGNARDKVGNEKSREINPVLCKKSGGVLDLFGLWRGRRHTIDTPTKVLNQGHSLHRSVVPRWQPRRGRYRVSAAVARLRRLG